LYAVQVGKDKFVAPEMNKYEFNVLENGKSVFNNNDIVGCYVLSDTYNRTSDSKGLLLNFPNSGNLASTFSWSWPYSLEDIEKIKGFSVNSLGVVLQHKQGGIVVNDTNGKILVVASERKEVDTNWDDAKRWCKELNYNGYNDWRLPTKEELNLFFVKFWGLKSIPGLFFLNSPNYYTSNFYWTSDECSEPETAIESSRGYNQFQCTTKSDKNKVIAVRSFYVNSKTQNGNNPSISDEHSNSVNNVQSNKLTDIDGNVYKTVTIGSQTWMAENLKTTHYQNGDSIQTGIDNVTWGKLKSGAYCNYENKESNGTIYGHLYNWYAAQDSRNIAPKGWHLPTEDEWKILTDYLGGEIVAGSKLKETGITYWLNPNIGATNESRFSALPGGARYKDGVYREINWNSNFWTSTTYENFGRKSLINLSYDKSNIFNTDRPKETGSSIRCIKD